MKSAACFSWVASSRYAHSVLVLLCSPHRIVCEDLRTLLWLNGVCSFLGHLALGSPLCSQLWYAVRLICVKTLAQAQWSEATIPYEKMLACSSRRS